MLLAGDVGGTKTDLAVYSREAGPHSPLSQAEMHSADYPSLQVLVKEFLQKEKIQVERACFDVAGPVIEGRAKVTNLPWEMDEASLAKDLNLKSVRLINDLEAVARAIPILRPDDVRTLNVGLPVPGGAIGVVAPGTGLGESFLTWDGSKYVPHSSEGGHSNFAPTDERQIRLLRYLLGRFDHVGVERVCSGIGIPNIYECLRDIERIPEDPDIAQSIATAKDRTAAIANFATDPDQRSKLCAATIETFISILASEMGNLALKVLADGGIYLGGGIPLHILNLLEKPAFMESFKRKGRFAQLMERIPVHVILNHAALVGSAAYGMESFKEEL
ncbi:MAG TPA: glucokinase [Pyrinomonadaceae bacterium]|nr:glucokinase [Pyrinomonadaceae bacterium]